ncbi:MAG: UvrD-helicase domain-containing protein, partial [Pseudomonadota bacterium]
MRGRIERLLNLPVGGMWIGTFHGLSHSLLRTHWQEAGLPQGFQILDSEDQRRLIKRTLKNLNLDEAYWPPRQVLGFINGHKEEGRRAKQLGGGNDSTQRELIRLYQAYEETCNRLGLVDFSELLLRSVELLTTHESLRTHYQNRFRYLLVDEFQDTNSIQYRWLKLFVGPKRNLFAVGDDDQSIYGWRGAKVENILQFERDNPGARLIRLEQNYRSTGAILRAANHVIAHNTGRLGKELWTAGAEGEPLQFYTAYNDLEEARFVVGQIEAWTATGRLRAEAAVLYRSNAQSRLFEEALIHASMPYRVYGGLRFFERQEIKNALAYLRLVASRHDDPSFDRVANVPTRGLGDKTLDAVRQAGRERTQSMWEASTALLSEQALPSRAAQCLFRFRELIEQMAAACAPLTLGAQVEHVVETSGLVEHYKKEKGEKGESRVENLAELVSAARGFEFDPADGLDPLSAFLAHAALEAGEGEANAWEDCVQLMSLH